MTPAGDRTKAAVTRDGAGPLWLQVAASIHARILAGEYGPGAQLPPDRQIAADYGTSRMTVRQALAALEKKGAIRIEHGNGTFVSEDPMPYAIGRRVRFDENLRSAELSPERRLLRWRLAEAAPDIAAALALPRQAPVIEMTIGAFADARPIAIGVHACCATRFAGFAEAFEQDRSFSRALRRYGVEDYLRKTTEITARMPTAEEAKVLRQARTVPVLAYTALDIDLAGVPISYFVGCFAAERVKIVVDLPAGA